MTEPTPDIDPSRAAVVDEEARPWEMPVRFTDILNVDPDDNTDSANTILLAEDDPHSGQTLQDYFEAKGFNTIWAKNGVDAIKVFRETRVDLALVDVMMPGADGYQVCQTIKSESGERTVPVIFLTAKVFPEDKAAGFASAADGYVTKPYDLAALAAEVDARLRVKVQSDALRQEKRALERLSTTDPLTGLPNRRFFDQRLNHELSRARRYGQDLGLLMVDVDHFKEANDGYGHPFGDAVLKEVASILMGVVRDVDIPARFGGDEFTIILPSTGSTGAATLAERIRSSVEAHVFSWPDRASDGEGGRSVAGITLTIGVAAAAESRFPEDCAEFIDWADKALYKAKSMGRNRVAISGEGQIVPCPAEQ